jgi:hypothetical protein
VVEETIRNIKIWALESWKFVHPVSRRSRFVAYATEARFLDFLVNIWSASIRESQNWPICLIPTPHNILHFAYLCHLYHKIVQLYNSSKRGLPTAIRIIIISMFNSLWHTEQTYKAISQILPYFLLIQSMSGSPHMWTFKQMIIVNFLHTTEFTFALIIGFYVIVIPFTKFMVKNMTCTSSK